MGAENAIDGQAHRSDEVEVSGEIRCEVKSLLLRNKKGEIEIVEKNAKSTTEDPYGKYALVSKQSFDENHKLTRTTLEINSQHILAVLKEVITFYPGESLDFNNKFTIEDPFMMLVHYRDDLRAYREHTSNTTVKMHIALLLDYLEEEAGPKGIEIQAMIAAGLIAFPLLWVIFKPGDIVCEHSNGHNRLFRVIKHGYGESRNGGKYFDISCSFLSFDGIKVGVAGDKLRIWDRMEFFGLFPTTITSLSLYPLKFLSSTERNLLQDAVAERGQRYLAIREMCVMQYHGLFLYLKRPPWDYYNETANYDGTFLPETMSGRVIIDPKTFNEEARQRKEEVAGDESGDEERQDRKDSGEGKRCEYMLQKDEYWQLLTIIATLNMSDNMVEKDLDPRLCPSYVYGFSLEKKEWCKFYVDSLSEVDWKPDALDSLILPMPQKRLLKGLVTGHKYPDRARDEVGLKGKGLVVLLHGTPGSGKTLTAGKTACILQRHI